MSFFECTHCKRIKPIQVSGGTGYGINKDNEKVCYVCCAKQELETMVETGKAVLYFCKDKVTDWAGELSFKVLEQRTSRWSKGYYTNGNPTIQTRIDYWFRTPDNSLWHGYTIGDFTQVAHCKRIKG